MPQFVTELSNNDFHTQIMTVKELVEDWYANVQGNKRSLGRIPSKAQKSRYVEALLIGMPLQPIYVDNCDGNREYIDGGERILSYAEFEQNKFPLTSLYYKMQQNDGLYFRDMRSLAKQKILQAKIQVHVLNAGLSRQDRFGIYACLKSRLDSDTLRSCRKRIYHDSYYVVESIADEVVKDENHRIRKTASLENEICHLLVSVFYKDFVSSSRTAHIDTVVNELLDESKLVPFVNDNRERIISVLRKSSGSIMKRHGVHAQDLYNAVCFYAGTNSISESDFLKAYKETSYKNRDNLDNVVLFSKRLQSIVYEFNLV